MTIIEDGREPEREKKDRKSSQRLKSETLSPSKTEFDKSYELNIRPKKFNDYVGQGTLKESLKISVEAANKRNLPLDHILFYGPPGLGKTTLASVIANEMNVSIKITSAPALERPRDIIGILMSLEDGEILFIDEIHRLNRITEEILYPAMEDYFLDMTTGKAQSVKTLRIPIPKFTLIGATTRAGELSGPLRDRFGIVHRLEFYTPHELQKVVIRSCEILKSEINEKAAQEIAKRSRGTPRIANRLVKRVSDYALVKHKNVIDEKIAAEALKNLKIDDMGLNSFDRKLLKFIIEKYNGGPVGLETIAAALGEDSKTIEDVYEPFLLQSGLLARTTRGRVASAIAKEYFES